MEHYDAGYDVMGEAIIDAFADVQKLFQHVVEAAHMEGAAFESSRREEEIRELKQRAARGDLDGVDDMNGENDPTSPSSPRARASWRLSPPSASRIGALLRNLGPP